MKKNLRVPPGRSTFPLNEPPLYQRDSRKQDACHKAADTYQGGNLRQESGERFVSRMDWSILMHRIFLALLGRAEVWAEEPFSSWRLPVRRVREMAQVTQKSIYEEAAEATTRLTCEPIEFWSRDGEDYEGYPLFSMCKYEPREGMIEAKLNAKVRPYLLRLRECFADRHLQQAIPLSTPYAIRTYEIAKMIERPGGRRSRQIPVGRFRKMFSLEDKYGRHSDMRRRVIDPSVEQVNEKTDVDVRCEDVRDGQTPIALQWTVESKGPEQDAEDESELRHAPGSLKKSEHKAWFEKLSPEDQKKALEEARQRARNSGYSEGRPRSFSASVMQMISRIYQEQNA